MFWIFAALSVFILRKKFPDMLRPYKVWGYPAVPILFIITSFGILINTIVERPVESLAGLGFTLLGIPVFWLWRRKTVGEREPRRHAKEREEEKKENDTNGK
jgi:APA family basic amino acid/polyamine antiporter